MKKKNLLVTTIAILGLATISMAQVPSYVPSNGLVGWWPFDGNANDESGNGNNGTVNGATLTTDRLGNVNAAYSFDGIDDYISFNTSNLPYANSDRTISIWFLKQNNNSVWSHTALAYGSASQSNAIMISVGNNNLLTVQGWADDIGTNQSSSNMWENILFTISSGVGNIYYNGNLLTTQVISNWNTIQSVFYCGTRCDLSNSFFYGNIDDIGIWNRALTQQEITDLYYGCQLSVNTQPNNQTININNNAQFAVSSPDPGAAYQWQTNLGVGFQNLNSIGQYSGTTTNTLNVSNVTMSNNNQPFRCIVSSGSCSDTSNVAVLTVNNNVGINESSQDNLFSVFPNPAQNIINVKTDSKLIGQVYSIYENTGRIVLTGKINSQNTTIELDNLSGGIYLFSVGANMKQTFKVIKE